MYSANQSRSQHRSRTSHVSYVLEDMIHIQGRQSTLSPERGWGKRVCRGHGSTIQQLWMERATQQLRGAPHVHASRLAAIVKTHSPMLATGSTSPYPVLVMVVIVKYLQTGTKGNPTRLFQAARTSGRAGPGSERRRREQTKIQGLHSYAKRTQR